LAWQLKRLDNVQLKREEIMKKQIVIIGAVALDPKWPVE
jgi:hypothetical protein